MPIVCRMGPPLGAFPLPLPLPSTIPLRRFRLWPLGIVAVLPTSSRGVLASAQLQVPAAVLVTVAAVEWAEAVEWEQPADRWP